MRSADDGSVSRRAKESSAHKENLSSSGQLAAPPERGKIRPILIFPVIRGWKFFLRPYPHALYGKDESAHNTIAR